MEIINKFLRRFLSKPPLAQKGEINYPFCDRFTFVHFLIGVAYAYVGLGFWGALFLALAWEALENPLKMTLPFIFPHATADTLKNSLGDTLAVLFGWAISHYGMIRIIPFSN